MFLLEGLSNREIPRRASFLQLKVAPISGPMLPFRIVYFMLHKLTDPVNPSSALMEVLL
jgi:hypothetical protein